MSFSEDDNIIVHNIEEKVTWKEAVISATPKPRPFVKIKGENYLAISSKSVEIFWGEIYWGRIFFRAESNLIQSSCRSFIRVIVPYKIAKANFRVGTKKKSRGRKP
jgi:hypothetical protein